METLYKGGEGNLELGQLKNGKILIKFAAMTGSYRQIEILITNKN